MLLTKTPARSLQRQSFSAMNVNNIFHVYHKQQSEKMWVSIKISLKVSLRECLGEVVNAIRHTRPPSSAWQRSEVCITFPEVSVITNLPDQIRRWKIIQWR